MGMDKIVELFSQLSTINICPSWKDGIGRDIIRLTVDDRNIYISLAMAYKNINNTLFFELYTPCSPINLYSYGEKDIRLDYARYREAFNVKHIRFKLWSIKEI